MSDCPGHGKCHGPVNFCSECGDVDLVCDDPECQSHSRYDEKAVAAQDARATFLLAERDYRYARLMLERCERELRRHRNGNPLMCARKR